MLNIFNNTRYNTLHNYKFSFKAVGSPVLPFNGILRREVSNELFYKNVSYKHVT